MIRHDSLRLPANAIELAKVCRALLFSVLAAALLLTLAAPSSHAQAETQYLYVVSNGLSTYSVDATAGTVTLVNAAPASSAPPIAGPVAINSSATYLFSIGQNSAGQGAVFAYSIAPSGAIQQTAPSPYSISQPTGTPRRDRAQARTASTFTWCLPILRHKRTLNSGEPASTRKPSSIFSRLARTARSRSPTLSCCQILTIAPAT